jgi:hypothetical protein
MQYLARPGDSVLNPTSDYLLLSAYATRKADGAVALLVINKDGMNTQTAQINLTNFLPSASATVRSYGIAQDEATRTNGPAAAQDVALTNFPSASTNFNATFPPYTLTLFTFSPAAAKVVPGSVTGGKYVFQVQGQAGTYQIQTSTNLSTWKSNSVITLTGSPGSVTNTMSTGTLFWRAVWMP